ncbi:replication-relaxation family protein [Pseudonocardia sp. TRM90224]|uniref:replication-relaxation family protein n=1 Tax=Pseudonocardia sp. TRM90224 TaxID=2812678 RepID=UPI002103959B|nr:replication-relaxation family protein [Pseudonocardia sp. TRM90224]
MLHEHQVLTSTDVHTMAFPSARSARQRLLELHDWDIVDRFQPLLRSGSAPMHYVLGAAGAAVLAAEEGISLRELGYRRDDVLAIAHRHTLAHTIAINGQFTHLIAASRHSTAARLAAWWSEQRCNRHIGDLVRPDAYGRIHLTAHAAHTPHAAHGAVAAASGTSASEQSFEWFLELDFGTESLPRLAAKLDSYSHLAAALPTRTVTTSGGNPDAVTILIWLPGRRREAHAREHLTHALRGLDQPHQIRIATASPSPSTEQLDGNGTGDGHAPSTVPAQDEHIWQPLDSLHPARQAAGEHRSSMSELARRWAAPRASFHEFIESIPTRTSRTVQLEAPDPLPPDPATFNPAVTHRVRWPSSTPVRRTPT